VSGNYWLAPIVPEYWCSDFATYVWQQAGIAVPTIPLVSNFVIWAKQHVRFTTDLSQLQVGDVIFYPHHVGVVVQVLADGTVQTADGDFGGETGWNAKHRPVPESYFAEHSSVELDTFNPRQGRGPGGTIVGVGLTG
jgi:cell wall-associated NlpC family hydrolase